MHFTLFLALALFSSPKTPSEYSKVIENAPAAFAGGVWLEPARRMKLTFDASDDAWGRVRVDVEDKSTNGFYLICAGRICLLVEGERRHLLLIIAATSDRCRLAGSVLSPLEKFGTLELICVGRSHPVSQLRQQAKADQLMVVGNE